PQGGYNQAGMGPYGGAMRPPVPGQTPQPMYEQQQAQQKMDMDQIPNPIEVMQANESKFGGQFFETNESGKMPPLTTTNFTCKDMGNCNPRFIRSSMYSVPNNADLLKQSKLPLVLSLTPFADLAEGESEPPAYMCPFMQFVDNGKKFQCPFCEDITQVSQEYFNHLDHMGKRVDTYERAELCCGSYEFTATKDYCRNQSLPQSPAIIFMIDVSVNSIRSGLLHVLCPYIKDVLLPNLPRDSLNPAADQSDLKVGFVTYDKELHFYNLKSSLAAPQMMIVSDIDEVFVPILDGFLVRLSESRTVIENLLDSLPSMFQENKETEIVLGPVVEAGIDALKSANLAGKLFIFHTNLPNCVAPGQLKMRDDKKLLATDKEKLLLSPQNDYYAQLGKKCVENGCTIDLFVMPNQYCDLATLSDLTRKTSGQIYKYDFFMADTHGQRLCEDLKYAVDKTVAFDAVMKVRTSTGIRPVDYIGNFGMYGNDIELAGVNKQTSLAVELKHDDKLNENAKVYIQAALLYTSLSGQRRIRVHNLSLNVCTQYSQVYSTCELDCMVNYMAKLACRSITVSTPKSIRENLVNQVSHILATYRKNCTNSPAKGQFILPETLKLLPVFSNSLLKSDAISGSQTVTTDERAYLMYRLMSMDIKSTYYYFYPRVLQV
ncbi:transport Sec24C-like isoform X1, partial [Brachionus plicatilis]